MQYNYISNLGKYFRLTKYPPIFIGGKNEILIDKNGSKYLDFACGSGTSVLGHQNNYMIKNLTKVVNRGFIHSGPHFLSSDHCKFFNELSNFLDKRFSIFNLATNGTEATETALKLAFHHTNKRKIIYFEGSYHGRTGYALSSSGMKGINNNFFTNTNFIECKFNSIEDFKKKFIKHKKDLAAVIIEPIQATSGFIFSESKFLKEIRRITTNHNKLLIFDEVWTGFGKTGFDFGYNYYKIKPDILILGKSLACGLPLGLVAFTKKINHNFPGAQSSTFQGNIIAINSSLLFLKYIKKIKYLDKIENISINMKTEMKKLEKFKFVKKIRGVGFMWGIEIDTKYFENPDYTNLIRYNLLKNKLITWECGKNSNVIGLIPPIIIPTSSIKKAFNIILKTFNKINIKI